MSLIDLPSLALILGAMARGDTRVTLSGSGAPGLDALAVALTALGATVTAVGPGEMLVRGTGTGGWREPDRVLDLGAVPGALPLLAGVLAVHDFTAVLAGDSDALTGLCQPLERLGARFTLRRGDRLPGAVTGTAWPLPALHEGLEPVAALGLLLAGLNSPGRTGVTPVDGLDAAIGLMRRLGATVEVTDGTAWVTGYPDLTGTDVTLGP